MGTKNGHAAPERAGSRSICLKSKRKPHQDAQARPVGAPDGFNKTLREWLHIYAWLQGALSPVSVTPLVRGALTKKTVMCAPPSNYRTLAKVYHAWREVSSALLP